MIKVSDYIAQRLKEVYEVSHLFMVSGGGAMHLNDSFGRYIDYICNHNEQACAIAAEGYARVNQQLGVVSVTTGPGGLNTLNGVFGSFVDSVPVLYISGQVKFATTIASCPEVSLRQLGDQEADITAVVRPLTKYAVMVTKPEEIKYHLDRAVYEATHGRFGPVWLDIPLNVQAAMIDENNLREFTPPPSPKYDLKIEETIAKLQEAKRPLIVLGHGVRLAGVQKEFKQLLMKAQLPVVTTLNGFDLIETRHPSYIGRIGTIGQRAGNFALQNADCVLFLGTRNNVRQTSYNWENYAKNAYKIIVDIDKAELCKPTVRPDLAIHSDLAAYLPALSTKIPEISRPDWLKWCQERRDKYDFAHTPEYQQTGGKINAYAFIRRLNQLSAENELFVLANATATIGILQTADIKSGQRYITNSGDASMGYDLPAAIGACIAAGNKQTICLAGDGSIMMNIQELQTIKNYNLPIKIFIINNDGYISIKQTQNNFFCGRNCGAGPNSGVTTPDFTKVGEAFGIKSICLENPEDVEKIIHEVLSAEGPMLCEVKVNPDYIFTPKLSARQLPDGTMISPSLEDMFPFLPEEEMKANRLD